MSEENKELTQPETAELTEQDLDQASAGVLLPAVQKVREAAAKMPQAEGYKLSHVIVRI